MKETPQRLSPSDANASSPAPLWRKSSLAGSPALGGSGMVSTHSPPPGGAGGSFQQNLLWVVMRLVGCIGWCREQWMLWCAIGTVLFAYYVPLLTSSDIVTSVCVALVFFLSGASTTIEELKLAVSNIRTIGAALLHHFLLSPVIAVGLYALPFKEGIPRKDLVLSGLLCAFCLPPSSASALVSTGAASGTESLTLCVSTIGNMLGLFLSPVLMRLVLTDVGEQRNKELSSFVVQYLLTVLLPLLLGQGVQYAVYSLYNKRREHEDLKRQATSAAVFCSEVCDTNQRNWRAKVRVAIYCVMLFLSYTLFCSLFYRPKTVRDRVSVDAVLYVFFLELGGFVVLAAIAWISTGMLPQLTAEDRVAAFYSGISKSEVLAIPLLSQLFVNSDDFAVLAIPCLLYHLIQCVGGSLLSFPLRQWRNRQHCKPGTTLLPLRYIRVPKHQHHRMDSGAEGED